MLRGQGTPESKAAALAECRTAAKLLESSRVELDTEEIRITYLADKLAIYDFGVYMACAVEDAQAGLELSQACKARVFVEKMHGWRPGGEREKPSLPSIAEIQKALAEGEALLDWHVGKEALTAFVLTSKGLRHHRIRLKRSDLEAMVQRCLKVIGRSGDRDRPGTCRIFLEDLGQEMLAPVWPSLESCRAAR